jgi:O-antigen/teichoic acid export membrane protein
VVGLPVFAILWPLIPLLLHKHPPIAVGWFRAFLVAMLLVLPMQNAFEYLRARGHNTKFNVYRSLPLVLTTLFIVGLALKGSLTLGTALACTFAANLGGALLVIVVERAWPRFGPGMFDWQLTKLQLHYGSRVWIGTLSNMVLARFDQILMVTIVSAAQLGHYAIAVTAAGLSTPVAQGVGFALFPFLRRDANPEARNRRMWQGFRWVLLGSLGICGLLALFMPWVIPVLFGEEYRASLPAFYVLLPGQVLWNLGLVFKTRLEADNLPGKGSHALILAALITLVGVPVAVPYFGIVGAAVVTVISQGAFCATCYGFILRNHGAVYDGDTPDDAGGDGPSEGPESGEREPVPAGS